MGGGGNPLGGARSPPRKFWRPATVRAGGALQNQPAALPGMSGARIRALCLVGNWSGGPRAGVLPQKFRPASRPAPRAAAKPDSSHPLMYGSTTPGATAMAHDGIDGVPSFLENFDCRPPTPAGGAEATAARKPATTGRVRGKECRFGHGTFGSALS